MPNLNQPNKANSRSLQPRKSKNTDENITSEPATIDKIKFNSSEYYRLEGASRFGAGSATELTSRENHLLSLVAQMTVWRKKGEAVNFVEKLPFDLKHMGYVILNAKKQKFEDQMRRSDPGLFEIAKSYIDWAERHKQRIQSESRR